LPARPLAPAAHRPRRAARPVRPPRGCRRRIPRRSRARARRRGPPAHHRPASRARRGTGPDRGDLMDVDAALQSQIRNIETTYGKPLDHWFAVIDASGLTKHNQVVAMLKADHGLAHGAAHRISLLARQRGDTGAAPAPSDPADALYDGAKAGLRPLHDALLGQIRALGAFDI